MAIKLKCDNRTLTQGAKYSYLSANYLSGVATFDVDNIAGFADNDYLLLGEMGFETTEIVQIKGVPAGSSIVLEAATSFAHPESTRVTIIPYNQVRFYHTATATYATTDPVTGYIAIQADSYFSIASDTTNTTGFGWFAFYNEETTKSSQNSNAIPYTGFKPNSVKKILDGFFSLLNNKEQKLISNDEAFSWLNEGYSVAKTELNLVNNEYGASDDTSITVVSGTKEYDLEDDFNDIISVWNDTDNNEIDAIDISKVTEWDENTGNETKYYLRGDYIGFSPTPTSAATIKYRYNSNITTLTSIYDNVSLPDNSYFILKDFMLYRAYQKMKYANAIDYLKIFNENINRMKLVSQKRTNQKESWEIDPTSNV